MLRLLVLELGIGDPKSEQWLDVKGRNLQLSLGSEKMFLLSGRFKAIFCNMSPVFFWFFVGL